MMAAQMRISRETITPDRARQLLDVESPIQRKVSFGVVRRYADDLRNGNWADTGETWSVTPDGALINGLHRAHAIIMSNVPMEAAIAYNVDESAFAYIDIGRKRTAHQFIDGPHGVIISGAVKLRIALDASSDLDNWQRIQAAIKIDDIIEYVTNHPALTTTAETALLINRACHIHAASMNALLSLAQESTVIVPESVSAWSTGLISGAGLFEFDPRLVLRERWARDYVKLNGTSSVNYRMRWALLIKTWNAYIRSSDIKILRARLDEPPPRMIV